MDYRIIFKEEFRTTAWSGGETSQLYIYPETSDFRKKDFLFRLSSASFTSEQSDFSDFTGYERYILALRGDLYLDHEKSYVRDLRPYEIDYFSGSWKTRSKNSLDCIDYNYIVRSGRKSKMQIFEIGETYKPSEKSIISLYSTEGLSLDLQGDLVEIPPGGLLIGHVDLGLTIAFIGGNGKIIGTEFDIS